jgi:PiT family inorganic phosphate transporter
VTGITIVVVLSLMLAWVNGANDVSKGIATLAGSGTTSARRAVTWGTLWTVVGGVAAFVWGSELVKTFGTDLVVPGTNSRWSFAASVLSGAGAWVALASYRGWPVSTTHALLGGLIGTVLAGAGFQGLRAAAVAQKAMLPLLLSPLLAIALCALLLLVAQMVAKRVPAWRPGCCAEEEWRRDPFVCAAAGNAAIPRGVSRRFWIVLHWTSSGLTSFARALNDVPKIAAFLILALALTPEAGAMFAASSTLWAFVAVTVMMGIGSAWGGYRVLHLMAHRVAAMETHTGLVANCGTSLLVLAATPLGLPVSTTHVSAGALFGIRWAGHAQPAQGDALNGILVAWIVTLPAAAGVAALTHRFLILLE